MKALAKRAVTVPEDGVVETVIDREAEAIRSDTERRLRELRAVACELWPDRDDAFVLSELNSVLSGIRAAEETLACQR